MIGWGRTAHGQSDTPSKLQVTEMRQKTTIKVVLAFHNLAQIQYKISTIHFYEAALVFIENDDVLTIRERQFLYNHCKDIWNLSIFVCQVS